MPKKLKFRILENTGDRTKLREYDCFDCLASWDKWLSDPMDELCPGCGSNNFTSRQGQNTMHMHADYTDEYQGADVFDQYNTPYI